MKYFLCQPRCLALVALPLLLPLASKAQTANAEPASFRNVVRLDVAGPFLLTLGYNAFRQNTHVVFPVLLGYERQLSPRLSGNLEVLLNGGTPGNERAGLAVQGRYYFALRQQTGLVGLYAAPTASYRAIHRDERDDPAGVDKLAGGGLLIGGQFPFWSSRHLVFDVAAGAMSWTLLNEASVEHRTHTYYPQGTLFLDGRLSLGYQF